MKIPLFQIDAFSNRPFSGNPAAVCPLGEWPDDKLLQQIAMENNLSETAFFVVNKDEYHIRWFTPVAEVDLCGHATLASAFVIFNHIDKVSNRINFTSKSGKLQVMRDKDLLSMDFPSQPPVPCEMPEYMIEGLGKEPVEILASEDYMAVYPQEGDILNIRPDMKLLRKLALRGLIITSRSETADFVSRFFAPKLGVKEDPVTGSAHCSLTPYWAKKLGKKQLHAFQRSTRGGELFLEDRGDRVTISGRAVGFMEGVITIL